MIIGEGDQRLDIRDEVFLATCRAGIARIGLVRGIPIGDEFERGAGPYNRDSHIFRPAIEDRRRCLRTVDDLRPAEADRLTIGRERGIADREVRGVRCRENARVDKVRRKACAIDRIGQEIVDAQRRVGIDKARIVADKELAVVVLIGTGEGRGIERTGSGKSTHWHQIDLRRRRGRVQLHVRQADVAGILVPARVAGPVGLDVRPRLLVGSAGKECRIDRDIVRLARLPSLIGGIDLSQRKIERDIAVVIHRDDIADRAFANGIDQRGVIEKLLRSLTSREQSLAALAAGLLRHAVEAVGVDDVAAGSRGAIANRNWQCLNGALDRGSIIIKDAIFLCEAHGSGL